jgi:hypothetical protein
MTSLGLGENESFKRFVGYMVNSIANQRCMASAAQARN